MSEYVNTREAAQMLKVAPRTIRYYRQTSKLTSGVLVGPGKRKLIFKRKEIESYAQCP